MERDKLIYWAGFFDGEGHIELAFIISTPGAYYGSGGHYYFQLWIDQRIEKPNEFFAELLDNFGGRIIPHKKWPGSFRWYIGGQNGRQFLDAILPYLRVKRRTAELAIEFQKSKERTRERHLIRLPASEIELRDKILEEYFSLFRGTKSKRNRKFGRDYLKQCNSPF